MQYGSTIKAMMTQILRPWYPLLLLSCIQPPNTFCACVPQQIVIPIIKPFDYMVDIILAHASIKFPVHRSSDAGDAIVSALTALLPWLLYRCALH